MKSIDVVPLVWVACLVCLSSCTPQQGIVVQEASYHDSEDASLHHEEHGDELVAAPQRHFELRTSVAQPGQLQRVAELPGEVKLNGDRLAHLTPRVSGIVREAAVRLGEKVGSGQVLAVLESSELADAKAGYLIAKERLELAASVLEREKRLYGLKASSQREYQDARTSHAEAQIELRALTQKLATFGVAEHDLDAVDGRVDSALTEYRIVAPFPGTVVSKHLTIGEPVEAEKVVLTIADLDTVWIDLNVYQRDIGKVHAGQQVQVVADHGDAAQLQIDFVQPLVATATRTALARVVAPNTDGRWHPGCYVTGLVVTSTDRAAVVVPDQAIVSLGDGDQAVFVETPRGYEPREVRLGGRAAHDVEILEGLAPGERYVSKGAFYLKAEQGKGSFGHGHAH